MDTFKRDEEGGGMDNIHIVTFIFLLFSILKTFFFSFLFLFGKSALEANTFRAGSFAREKLNNFFDAVIDASSRTGIFN